MADFWAATPRQLMIVIAAYQRRRGWLAWHTGGMAASAFKDPTIEDFMGLRQRKRVQSPDEMLANLRRFKTGYRLKG